MNGILIVSGLDLTDHNQTIKRSNTHIMWGYDGMSVDGFSKKRKN
jgi:hypothetical protein